ncbi:MAG: MobC family plasmid mobilization relaxosome protein [Bacteroides sp.]|nr:MobC family plasmid mobilization relaxosome protein [Eubacterium sp.]MCM1419139.1 MobC family plasmid mobilization relaxosome protein [Roseburia sp.]MCM1463226.1 MobC family plasmid mobilization relaxosome protein [Bacteroides sp.]
MPYKNEIRKGDRKTRISFYISDEELTLIQAKMKIAGYKNMSRFLRRIAVYDRIHVYRYDELSLDKISAEISKIGTNVNQVAARVNTTGNLYREDVISLHRVLNEIKKYQLEILRKLPPGRKAFYGNNEND